MTTNFSSGAVETQEEMYSTFQMAKEEIYQLRNLCPLRGE